MWVHHLIRHSTIYSIFDWEQERLSWDQLGKIRQHGGKERLKISKIDKFESDLLKTNKGIAPQSRVILRDVCMVGGKLVAPPCKRL